MSNLFVITVRSRLKILKSFRPLNTTKKQVYLSSVKLDIQLPPDFPEKYKASVLHVAGLCKVKKSIANPPVFEIITSQVPFSFRRRGLRMRSTLIPDTYLSAAQATPVFRF